MEHTPTTIEPKKIEEQEPTHGSPPSSDLGKDMNVIGLAGFFGIHTPSTAEEGDLKYILEHFVRRGVTEMPEILLNLRQMLGKMGPIEVTMSKLGAIKRYLRTTAGIEQLLKEKQSMEKYG